jgi:hypothetical protein
VAEPFPDESAVAGVEPEAVAALQPAADATAPPPAAPTLIVSEGELGRGDTLGAALHRSNVSQNVIHLVTSKLSKIFNFRHAQPGHSFRLVQDLEGELLDFRYRTNAIDSIHLALEDGGYVVRREEVELTPRISHIAGVVDSNLYTAMRDLGEEPRLANDFTDVFAWDVDFSRTVQSGDEFRVLYERLYYTHDSGAVPTEARWSARSCWRRCATRGSAPVSARNGAIRSSRSRAPTTASTTRPGPDRASGPSPTAR